MRHSTLGCYEVGMRKVARWGTVVLAGFLAQSTGMLACDESDDCPAGTEGCPCTEDNLCLQGLLCLSSYCVGAASAGNSTANEESGSAVDNVAACESWRDSVSCGDTDIAQFVDCNLYADTVCDIAEYFACLDENTACNDGVFDNSGWQSCADLATCE